MKINCRLFILVAAVSVFAFVGAELIAFFIMPAGIPAALRFLSAFLFPAGTFILFPVYRKFDKQLSVDTKKIAGERKMHALLVKTAKISLWLTLLFLLQTAALFGLYSGLVARVFGFRQEMTVYMIMILAVGFLGAQHRHPLFFCYAAA